MRVSILRLSLLSCISSALLAADPARIPPEAEEIIGLARSLPAEFTADVLIRVAERLRSTHPKAAKQLLEDAFTLSSRSREPLPRRAWPESAERTAYQHGLDALSLGTRAAKAMASLDRKLALEYFATLLRPSAEPHTCADRTVWQTDAYWELAEVLRPPALPPIVSALEIPAAAKLVMSRDEDLSGWLLDGLERLPADDRAFSFRLRDAVRGLESLAIHQARKGRDPAPVLVALGRYLSRSLSGARCEDTLAQTQPAATGLVWYFNERLRAAGYMAKAELSPIREEDSQPGRVIPAVLAESPAWWADFQKLSGAGGPEIAGARLFDEQPLAWWVWAEPVASNPDAARSPNPVIATYARLRQYLAR